MVEFAPRGVQARVCCVKKEQVHAQEGGTVRLSPVTGNSLTNKEFWKYTPSGTFEFNTVNPAAYEYFKLGEEYMVNLTLVPPAERLEDEAKYHEASAASLRTTGKDLGGYKPYGEGQPEAGAIEHDKSAAMIRERIRELAARGA